GCPSVFIIPHPYIFAIQQSRHKKTTPKLASSRVDFLFTIKPATHLVGGCLSIFIIPHPYILATQSPLTFRRGGLYTRVYYFVLLANR
ncbi:hypothetical protein, partial [Phascolarctobacterium succinatutens]|uniref:hypothetical protein n=1 Tax=Phascolarctobacterium succinatutens TaxID=626940 RepID=UPI0026F1FF63